jgi:hypothetical protein
MKKLLLITIMLLSNNNFAAYIEEDLLLDCSVIYEYIPKHKNKIIKDVLFFRPTLEEQTYISDYLQKKYSALDGALRS